MEVGPRLAWPSWRWMMFKATPSWASSRALGVAELVRRKSPADSGVGREAVKLEAHTGTGPAAAAGGAIDDAEQRPDRQLGTRGEPGAQLFPAPGVHADLAPSAALALADEQRPAVLVEIGLEQRKRLVDAQPGAPEHHDHCPHSIAVAVISGLAHGPRRSPPPWADRPGSAGPCCAARVPRDDRVAWRASDAGQRRQAARTRTWGPLPPSRIGLCCPTTQRRVWGRAPSTRKVARRRP